MVQQVELLAGPVESDCCAQRRARLRQMEPDTVSIRIMTAVWDRGPAQPPLRLLLLALADNANDQGVCWPSLETLGRKCAVEPRTVRRNLRQLEDGGWISSTMRTGQSTSYLVHTPDVSVPPDVAVRPVVSVPTPPDAGVPTPRTPASAKPSLNRQPEPSENTLTLVPLPDRDPDWHPKDGPLADSQATMGQLFPAFWSAYPRKIAKGTAQAAWGKAVKAGHDPQAIVDGAVAYAAHVQAQRISTQYQPHPTTWLNGLRWLDDLTVDVNATDRRRDAALEDIGQDGSWARTGDGGWK